MKGKGKGWGSLTKAPSGKEYRQRSIHGGHKSGAGLDGKFSGGTKGNRDLPINRTKGVKSGVGDPLGAGGS